MGSDSEFSADSERPTKRQRIDTPPRITPATTAEEEGDDASLYGTPSKLELPTKEDNLLSREELDRSETEGRTMDQQSATSEKEVSQTAATIPGLGLSLEASKDAYYEPPTPKPAAETDSGDMVDANEAPLVVVGAEDMAIDTSETILPTIETSTAEEAVLSGATSTSAVQPSANQAVEAETEFIEVAKASRGDPTAEWQYDSSDAETSSSSSSSDSSDSDEDYELLDPITQAKILMADGSDDEGPSNKSKRDHVLRTQNEVVEEPVERPDIIVTPDMQITELGRVGKIVDQLVLVEADNSGDYQVLDHSSVLCLEDRKIIGVIADTLGRVQKPLYTVRFNNAAEIAEYGVFVGTKIYYVVDHSKYVFTQALRQMKGTDASNIYDEEVGDHEREFSDDEAEAAWKREQKLARQNKAGGGGKATQGRPDRPHNPRNSRTPGDHRNGMRPGAASSQTALQYDEPGDDLYTPLSRPQNFEHMMSASPPRRSSSVQMTDYDPRHSSRDPREVPSGFPPRPPAVGTHSAHPPPGQPSLPQLTPEQQQWAQLAILQQMQAAAAAGSPSPFTPPPPPSSFMQTTQSFVPPPPPGFSFPGQSPSPASNVPTGSFNNPPFSNSQSPGIGGPQQQPGFNTGAAQPDPDAAFRAAQAQLDILKNLSKR